MLTYSVYYNILSIYYPCVRACAYIIAAEVFAPDSTDTKKAYRLDTLLILIV